jgi:hypothetical protein
MNSFLRETDIIGAQYANIQVRMQRLQSRFREIRASIYRAGMPVV